MTEVTQTGETEPEVPLHGNRSFRILVSNESLEFHPSTLDDPVPLGRQILSVAGYEPLREYSLFAILPSGDFEDVRLDEPFDIRGKGVERFVAFRSDRSFRLTLNDREIRWGFSTIPGSALYALAKPSDEEAIFLDVRGGQHRLIEPCDAVELADIGVERLYTAPHPPQTYEIIVNGRLRTVTGNIVTFDQIVQLAFPGAHDSCVGFDVTYQKAAAQPPVGQLGPTGSIKIKKGTVFNVTRTVQS
ncbi:MAG: multiubiquitin domain-containing protein [Zavarzinella sp.]